MFQLIVCHGLPTNLDAETQVGEGSTGKRSCTTFSSWRLTYTAGSEMLGCDHAFDSRQNSTSDHCIQKFCLLLLVLVLVVYVFFVCGCCCCSCCGCGCSCGCGCGCCCCCCCCWWWWWCCCCCLYLVVVAGGGGGGVCGVVQATVWFELPVLFHMVHGSTLEPISWGPSQALILYFLGGIDINLWARGSFMYYNVGCTVAPIRACQVNAQDRFGTLEVRWQHWCLVVLRPTDKENKWRYATGKGFKRFYRGIEDLNLSCCFFLLWTKAGKTKNPQEVCIYKWW